ncbi:hypothetical protein HU200_037682 [Digitaria exilis]|uniref:Uncharacterized protein n=1 Tax=Digitaria exilis TaxID=1010633 RepID=A0A835BCS9_9POAL|nr:hypothetical protein HU200_037682 [Digitaria exilis]
MMVQCPYSVQVWRSFSPIGLTTHQPATSQPNGLKQWWTAMIGQHQPQRSSIIDQAVIYIAWNIWKERCRRVFDNKELDVNQLVVSIKQDIANWNMTHNICEE